MSEADPPLAENRLPVVERSAFTTGHAFRSGSRLFVGQARVRGDLPAGRQAGIFSNRHRKLREIKHAKF
ncbi:MAG: hypothetical protein AAB366_00205 [Patescibacteria group bacterium]